MLTALENSSSISNEKCSLTRMPLLIINPDIIISAAQSIVEYLIVFSETGAIFIVITPVSYYTAVNEVIQYDVFVKEGQLWK